MKTIVAFIGLMLVSGVLFGQKIIAKQISVQAAILNVRAEPSLKAKVLVKLKREATAEAIGVGKAETIDGITDYWYKIKTEDGIVGYAFGHLISLKAAGQKKITATFEGCDMGDIFHISFGGVDYGEGNNNLGGFDFCNDDSSTNPKYMGKRFILTVNDLYSRVYCEQGGGNGEVCVELRPSIVAIAEVK